MVMDSTRVTILTPIGGSHRETEVFINWRGLSHDQWLALAQRAVIAAVQQDMKSNNSAPDKLVVEASWFVDRTGPSSIRKLGRIKDLPEHLQGKRDKEEPAEKMDAGDIVSGLSAEEKAALIALLSNS